jgi:hypothetical protein
MTNRFKNRGEVIEYFFVSDADHAITEGAQLLGSQFVTIRLLLVVMYVAVNFDSKFACRAIEIENKRPHGILPPKFEPTQPPVSQRLPQLVLGTRHAPA